MKQPIEEELYVMHGFDSHPQSDCSTCDDCIETLRRFEEFKKTPEYKELLNGVIPSR